MRILRCKEDYIMSIERVNHPYLTAIKRTDLSAPVRYLLRHDLLKGRILDFGCGFGYDTDELKGSHHAGRPESCNQSGVMQPPHTIHGAACFSPAHPPMPPKNPAAMRQAN